MCLVMTVRIILSLGGGESLQDFAQFPDAVCVVSRVAAVTVEEDGKHAGGGGAFEIPARVVADEAALGRWNADQLGSAVEDGFGGLPPADIAAENVDVHRVVQ